MTYRGHASGECSVCGHRQYYAESESRRRKHGILAKRYAATRVGNGSCEPQVGLGYRCAMESIRLWKRGEELTTEDILRDLGKRHQEVCLTRLQLLNAIKDAKKEGLLIPLRRPKVGQPALYRKA